MELAVALMLVTAPLIIICMGVAILRHIVHRGKTDI